MKTTFINIIPLVCLFLSSCVGNSGSAEEEAKKDSLSLVKQRESIDSMKRRNPLLIMPPDSEYTGSYVDKYGNGITKFTGFFRQGKRHGQWMSFYPNGEAWSEMHYDKGLRHGPNIAYFENGRKRYEGNYKNDQQDSVWNYYDTTGKLAEKVLFRDSRMIRRLPVE
jgi:antitoxin component YwqK of YwqJK toxin-antitoxin module